MCGELDLAKILSLAWGNPKAQTIEYKGFDREKARNLPRLAIRGPAGNAPLPRVISVTHYD
jgi:hypothetical protein